VGEGEREKKSQEKGGRLACVQGWRFWCKKAIERKREEKRQQQEREKL